MKDLKERNVTFTADPYWPHRYEAERERIQDVSDDRSLGVFHVGSTAIPDVPGKPALDIVAVYDDEESMVTAIERLTSAVSSGAGMIPERRPSASLSGVGAARRRRRRAIARSKGAA